MKNNSAQVFTQTRSGEQIVNLTGNDINND